MALLSWYRRLCARPPQEQRKERPATAEEGDPDAQFARGLQYSTGSGIAQDLSQAVQWYQKAADQNHPLAQFNLGMMFAHGQGVPVNEATALVWFRKAAEGGDAGAQHSLGSRCHRNSMDRVQVDTVESRIEAFKWFSLAAAQGYQGSDSARERMALGMTREEVAEGNQRAAAFVAGRPPNSP